MRDMVNQPQESRTMTVSARVTPAEKHAIEFVAGAKGTDVSSLLREHSITAILAERERVAGALAA
jgi:hypothetical protein